MNLNLATLILSMLSSDGYWISGQTQSIAVAWNVKAPAPEGDANLVWEIRCSGAKLASGRSQLAGDRKPAEIHLQAPTVRVATSADFVYRLETAKNSKLLAEGKYTIHLYPDDLLAGAASRLAGKRVFVWDRPEELPSLLKGAKIEHTAIHENSELHFASPDVVLVGDNRLGTDAEEQSSLLNLAAGGANVMFFRQTQPAVLAGYAVTRRAATPRLAWLADHPLARERESFETLAHATNLRAIRLPADEPALAIAWWPVEIADQRPAPIDSLLLVKAVGRGRLVLCQLPLGAWQTDARSQLFLAAALDYLLSPVQPTPPPSRRGHEIKTRSQEVPTITLPSGGSP